MGSLAIHLSLAEILAPPLALSTSKLPVFECLITG
jgi:hypothetical protein